MLVVSIRRVQWLPNVLAAVSQWIHLAASVTLQLTARSSPCPVKTLKNGTIISFSDIWPGKFEPKLTSCLDRNCWMLSFYYPSEIVLLTGRVIGMVRSEWQLLALVCTRGLHIGRILWLNLDRAERTAHVVRSASKSNEFVQKWDQWKIYPTYMYFKGQYSLKSFTVGFLIFENSGF